MNPSVCLYPAPRKQSKYHSQSDHPTHTPPTAPSSTKEIKKTPQPHKQGCHEGHAHVARTGKIHNTHTLTYTLTLLETKITT